MRHSRELLRNLLVRTTAALKETGTADPVLIAECDELESLMVYADSKSK